MIAHILTLAAALWLPSSGADPVACELVDLPAADNVLGAGTVNVSGDAEPGICWYRDDAGTMLTVQIFDDEFYDILTLGSGTPAEVGDRGRVSEMENGTVTVQFARGDYSLTIVVRPVSKPETSLLAPMLDLARTAADRLP